MPREAANGEGAAAAAAVAHSGHNSGGGAGEAGQWAPRTAKPEVAPAWLSAAQRELAGAPQGEEQGEVGSPAEGEDAPTNNGKPNGKQNGKRK